MNTFVKFCISKVLREERLRRHVAPQGEMVTDGITFLSGTNNDHRLVVGG